MMKYFKQVNKQKACNLIIGISGITITHLLSEYALRKNLLSAPTSLQIDFLFSLCLYPILLSCIIGGIYVKLTIKNSVKIPILNGMITGFMAAVFNLILSYEVTHLYFLGYGIGAAVLAALYLFFLSGNFFFVLFSVYCSRVEDSKFRLGKKQLVTGGLILIGFLLNPGTFLLIINYSETFLVFFAIILAGFFFDLLAQIKFLYKPKPVELMANINMWQSLWMIIIIPFAARTFPQFLEKFTDQRICNWYTVLHVISLTLFQIFAYWMVIQFRQHFLPYTLALIYGFIGCYFFTPLISVVAVLYEFITEITQKNSDQDHETILELNKNVAAMELRTDEQKIQQKQLKNEEDWLKEKLCDEADLNK